MSHSMKKHRDSSQTYHLGRPKGITVEKVQDGKLYNIPEMGISAGALNINGASVYAEDEIYIAKAVRVEHEPKAHSRGLLTVHTMESG